ncbi:MAG: ATP-dependent helicase/nuclease subunit, partial [Solirubrobacterales bacterium]|nr:ATP-dependent helicase/nuclease subunit [Solirubrobacterales bacterium]
RCDPSVPPEIADWVERDIRRGDARTAAEATAGWSNPPLHLLRLQEASSPAQRLVALARAARSVAEGVHREQAPLAESAAASTTPTPVVPLELRAGAAAAELLAELAAVGRLPGCEPPDVEDAIAALEGASVAAWRGPAEGRVRIASPYRVRGARALYLFCASLHDGEFPAGPDRDPLLGEERRAALGIAALRRRDQADEERYLFHACVSRPLSRLYLSWQSSDENGVARGRSPFVDEVFDLLSSAPQARTRGLERVVPAASEAFTVRGRARAAALAEARREERPGPLRSEAVVAELTGRSAQSAGSLENWLGCSYKWFVDHELSPVRLAPESDPLWLGSVVHAALERLYAEAPGSDSIPRPGDLDAWQERFSELLDDESGEGPTTPERRAGLARMRAQVNAFLADESRSETELRPRPDLLEWSFGIREGDAGELDIGGLRLHGIVDRVDVAPDGRGAVVRDYKSGATVSGSAAFGEGGVLQIPLYMKAIEELAQLEPIAGLYQPLGAYRDRRPRGIALAGDERLKGLELVRTDVGDADGFAERVAQAVAAARDADGRMRRGDIKRDPLGGRCPKYCSFQTICRLERAIGVDETEDEDRE